jgi:hypothetical protein
MITLQKFRNMLEILYLSCSHFVACKICLMNWIELNMPSYVIFKSSPYSIQDADTKRHSRYLLVKKWKCSRCSGPLPPPPSPPQQLYTTIVNSKLDKRIPGKCMKWSNKNVNQVKKSYQMWTCSLNFIIMLIISFTKTMRICLTCCRLNGWGVI